MTTLLTIPSAKALHIPVPNTAPLPLSTGDLNLVLIPANPPSHPSQTVTLSVGSSSFPLLPNSPLQRVKSKLEHPSYLFTPLPVAGGAPIGQVLIQMKDSKNQGEWDATESLCHKLEEELKKHSLWEEKIHFFNDEYDTQGTPVKGWGEHVADSVTGGASYLAAKIASLADGHVSSTTPGKPRFTAPETAGTVSGIRNSTAHFAAQADEVGANVGTRVHETGQDISNRIPDSVKRAVDPPAEVKQAAADGWEQVTIAAKGIASAASAVGKSVSDSAHKAIQHNLGTEADRVAQDIGQTGANVVSAAASVGTATSAATQGSNLASGAYNNKPL